MKIPEMGGQAPKTEESMDEKLIQAEALRSEIKKVVQEIRNIEQEIQRATRGLVEKRRALTAEYNKIAEEVLKDVPKVRCISSDYSDALESGNYYVIGLPDGVDLGKVRIEAFSNENNLIIDGKEYTGDWDYAERESEALDIILDSQHKETKK